MRWPWTHHADPQQDVLDQIVTWEAQGRGLIPSVEYQPDASKLPWDIYGLSSPLYDFWSNFVPSRLRYPAP